VPRAESPTPRPFTIGARAARTDIEIVITKPDRNPTTGRFSLALRTPHPVPVPDTLPDIDLEDDAQSFARLLIDQVRQHHGKPLMANVMRSVGRRIAVQLKPPFWEAFGRVAQHVLDTEHRVPTVLLLAGENLVPWELATLPTPLDPARPPFLAAQTSMGRWILDESAVPLPPAERIDVTGMAVLAGHYEAQTGLAPLPHAVEEATEIGQRFGAIVRFASQATLSALLGAQLEDGLRRVGVEVVHFSGHGEVDPHNPGASGIFLEDGSPISPILFSDSDLGTRHHPFIFLNACMVGTGGQMLGDCSGFPGECLGGGFRGLVAPLWEVRDVVAKEVALDFYAAAFGAGGAPRPLGEVLREIRARYAAGSQPQPTYLAYVLYGHPALTLNR
jgi:hypothetical protein